MYRSFQDYDGFSILCVQLVALLSVDTQGLFVFFSFFGREFDIASLRACSNLSHAVCTASSSLICRFLICRVSVGTFQLEQLFLLFIKCIQVSEENVRRCLVR